MKRKIIKWFYLISLIIVSSSNIIRGDFNHIDVYASLPTNINVSNYDDDQVNAYYTGVSEKSGDDLLEELNNIVYGHNEYHYDNTQPIFKIIDRNWDLSPLSPAQLANFNYNTDMPYIRKFYADYNDDIATADLYKNPGASRVSFDREHIWTQSLGNFGRTTGAGSDLHALIASDVRGNQQAHNNYNFAEPISSISYITNDKGGNVGQNGYISGYTQKVFEPIDEYKGDIARAMFYMAARYYTYESSEKPKLMLINGSPSAVTANASQPGLAGALETLLEWNELDPVDEYEIHRNNLIYNNYQYNRNPFIDHPEWARIAFDPLYDGSGASIEPGSSSVGTGISNPFDDATLLSISLNTENVKTEFSLEDIFTTAGLVVTAYYDGDLQRNVSSIVTDPTIGSTLNSAGPQTVTVTHTHNGVSKSQTYTIQVSSTSRTLTSLTLDIDNVTKSFTEGDYFDFDGLQVTANFDNDTSELVFDYQLTILGINYTFEDMIVPTQGTYDVVISYSFRGVTKTSSYSIEIDLFSINPLIYETGFESATKTAYASSVIDIDGVDWTLNQALIGGGEVADKKVGDRNIRGRQIDNTTPGFAKIEEQFEYVSNIEFKYANYGTLTNGRTTLEKSYDGLSWILVWAQEEVKNDLTTVSIPINEEDPIYIRFLFYGTTTTANNSRINIDDVKISYGELIGGGTSDKSLSNISVIPGNDELNFPIGSIFTYNNLQVFAHYSDSSLEEITQYTVFSPDTTTIGEKQVDVVYAGKQSQYTIKVGTLQSISVTPSVTSVPIFEDYFDNDLTATATFFTGVSSFIKSIDIDDLTIGSISTSTLGNQTISVSYSWGEVTETTSFVVKVTNQNADITSYAEDLIISEYIEGSSYNKAIEIYNGTGQSVDLSRYGVKLFSNGATSPSSSINLASTLSHDNVLVIAHGSANDTILNLANITHNGVANYNGDDVIGLYKDDILIDIIGEIGLQSEWNVTYANGSGSLKDKTLVRMADVITPTTTFNPLEWNVNPVDTTSNLGSHTMNNTANSLSLAIAYAEYFLEVTGPYCEYLDGINIPWNELKEEYLWMSSNAKDDFKNSSNSDILNAKQRYQFLINKYAAFNEDNFMVDGNNQLLFVAEPIMIRNDPSLNIFITGLALTIVSVITINLYGQIKQRKIKL
jgi:endonuclease I